MAAQTLGSYSAPPGPLAVIRGGSEWRGRKGLVIRRERKGSEGKVVKG